MVPGAPAGRQYPWTQTATTGSDRNRSREHGRLPDESSVLGDDARLRPLLARFGLAEVQLDEGFSMGELGLKAVIIAAHRLNVTLFRDSMIIEVAAHRPNVFIFNGH